MTKRTKKNKVELARQKARRQMYDMLIGCQWYDGSSGRTLYGAKPKRAR